jgi:hypothetical protein
MKRKVYKNEKGVTWSSSHAFKEFWGSLSAIHCKIFPENVRITPFPSSLIIPISHSSGVCPLSLSSRLPNGAPYWCVHIPSASYPYKALFLSSCPCSRILYETPSVVVLVHQLHILTKRSSWVPVLVLASYTRHHPLWSLSISFISLRSTLPEFLSLFSHPIRGTVHCGPCPSASYPYEALFLSSYPCSRILYEAPSIVVRIPSASYPYEALFLSSCPCSRILYETPSIVALVHQLHILTKHSSWVPVLVLASYTKHCPLWSLSISFVSLQTALPEFPSI